jgi:hypothetical protein
LEEISGKGQEVARILFVVPRCEAAEFKRAYPWSRVLVVENNWKTGSINQWIAERGGSPWKVWIDDDFTLARRKTLLNVSQAGTTVKTVEGVIALFEKIRGWFTAGYVHGGVSMRQANHYCTETDHLVNSRVCGLIFCDTRFMALEGIRFDAVQEHQAYHVALSLMELGYENVVDYEFMFGHHGTNATGGCSLYRTVEYLEAQNRLLQALHPRSVGLFYRKVGNPDADAISTDEGIPAVRIGWSRAVCLRQRERIATARQLRGTKLCSG